MKTNNNNKSMKNVTKMLKTAVLGLMLTGAAQAATISTTLDQLLPGGQYASGITLGDKKYSEFSYDPTGAAPAAPKDVNVKLTTTDNQHYQLRFAFGLAAIGNETSDMLIGYRLDVVNSTDVITNVGLAFNGFVGSPLALAQVSETVHSTNGSDVSPGLPIQDTEIIGVFTDGAGGAPDITSKNLAVNPTQSLRFTKDILVTSRGNGNATISWVDNSVDQTSIPEPTSLGLVGAAGAMLLTRRNRKA